MTEGAERTFVQIIGLVLMVVAVVWIGFNTLLTLALGIAWIGETGLTDELKPWLVMLFGMGTVSAGFGYIVFFIGRWMRERG